MWPLPIIRDEYVGITINPASISCAWLKSSKKYPLILNAYTTIQIDTPSSIAVATIIHRFIARYNLQNSTTGIALASPHIHEQLVRLFHASPSIKEFVLPSLTKMHWDYRYLHPLEDNQYLFYVCGISNPVVFSYQLLSYKEKLHLTSLTSSYMALLYAYKTVFGPAFRQSQMAIDMMQTNYKIENAMSTDSIARLMHIPAHVSINMADEKIPLLTLIGLYYQERSIE